MKEKSKYGMPPPNSRASFEHNIFLLIDDLEQHAGDEAFLANRAWALSDSLEHARYLPNRRIEIANIDERIRNLANMMDWMKYLPPIQFEKNHNND
ncbi:MAG: hypothetical protein IJE99_05440 [Alistipes sp.]|nr:hypothetical protein [Alistipes sp.]MBQ3197077.1 hypothetical protein [Alistipes sp.]